MSTRWVGLAVGVLCKPRVQRIPSPGLREYKRGEPDDGELCANSRMEWFGVYGDAQEASLPSDPARQTDGFEPSETKVGFGERKGASCRADPPFRPALWRLAKSKAPEGFGARGWPLAYADHDPQGTKPACVVSQSESRFEGPGSAGLMRAWRGLCARCYGRRGAEGRVWRVAVARVAHTPEPGSQPDTPVSKAARRLHSSALESKGSSSVGRQQL